MDQQYSVRPSVNQLEKFKGKEQIIVFCQRNRSGQAKMMEQNGFKNVINGGTWQDEAIAK
jgi:hypothetical protein